VDLHGDLPEELGVEHHLKGIPVVGLFELGAEVSQEGLALAERSAVLIHLVLEYGEGGGGAHASPGLRHIPLDRLARGVVS